VVLEDDDFGGQRFLSDAGTCCGWCATFDKRSRPVDKGGELRVAVDGGLYEAGLDEDIVVARRLA